MQGRDYAVVLLWSESFCEHVSGLLQRWDIFDVDKAVVKRVADKVIANVEVFRASVMVNGI